MAPDSSTAAPLDELVARRARDDGGRPFCLFGDAVVTFAELAERVGRLAAGLAARGLGPGGMVAVMLDNHPDHVVTFLALARLGAPQVPVNVQLRGPGLRYLLEHSGARAVIADVRHAEALVPALGTGVERVVWRGGVGRPHAGDLAFEAVAHAGATGVRPGVPPADRLVSVTYTSGTTGPPKGVMLGERAYLAAGRIAGLLADVGPTDVMLTWEPLYHIGGSQVVVTCLQRGVPMALLERFSASTLWAEARRHGATRLHYLGAVLALLLKQPPRADDADHPVRIAWGGGAPAVVWEPFEQRFGVRIRECYGMTEAASFTTVNLEGRVGSIGRPVPHFDVRVVGDDGEDTVPGAAGEILVREREPGLLMRGYFRDPDATAAALRGGWLHTGDLATRDADGFLRFVGRRKDSLRRRGENVSAWEIERVVATHDAVEDCAVIGVPAEVGEEDVKLFVKPAAGRRLDPAELRRWCEGRLARFQLPRYVALVDAFPRTPTERIRKDALSRSTTDCWDAEGPA